MTNEKMEQRLASAVEKTAPNDVNGVLSRCDERKGTVIPMTTNGPMERLNDATTRLGIGIATWWRKRVSSF